MRATRRFLRLGGIWRSCFGRLDGLHADALHLGGVLRRSLGAWVGVCAVVLGALLSACDVHQFPELDIPSGPDTPTPPPTPPEPDGRGGILLHLRYEPDVWLWEHLYDPKLGTVSEQFPDSAVDDAHPGTTERRSGVCDHGVMRAVVRAFSPGNLDRCVGEYVLTHDVADGYDIDAELDLAPGDYVLVVWSDMSEREGATPYYDAADFRRVQLRYAAPYPANTDLRDAYRGRMAVTVASRPDDDSPPTDCTVTMRRPMAKLEFVTTDLSEFLEREGTRRGLPAQAVALEDYLIEVFYAGYLPCSYSAVEDRLENSATGVRFAAQVQVTGESEASLGFDYVFINDTNLGGVLCQVAVYDVAGELVAGSLQFTAPLRRNHHTLLRGAFLSVGGGGGVGVDPGYDGDHNVTVP